MPDSASRAGERNLFPNPIAARNSGSNGSNHSAKAEVQYSLARRGRHRVVGYHHRDVRQVVFGQVGQFDFDNDPAKLHIDR